MYNTSALKRYQIKLFGMIFERILFTLTPTQWVVRRRTSSADGSGGGRYANVPVINK